MLREYLKSLADKFREVLGYEEGDPINAQDFINKIPEAFDLGTNQGYENGIEEGYWIGYFPGYEDGQASMVDENKIIEKTVKSTGSVIVNDVNQIKHDLKIKLSLPPEGTSFENISITQRINNLATDFGIPRKSYALTENIKVKPNTDYTVQFPYHEKFTNFFVHLVQTNKNVIQYQISGSYTTYTRTFNTGDNTELYLQVNCSSEPTEEIKTEILQLLNFNTQLELGNSVTEPIVVYANADGIVEGLKSESPITKLIADCSVNIELTYNRDWGMDYEWNRVEDEFHCKGTRTNYEYAYARTGAKHISPKYVVKPTSRAASVFADSPYLETIEGSKFDFSNISITNAASTSGLYYTFSQCPNLKVVPDMKIPAGGMYKTFLGDEKLETIEVLRVNSDCVFDTPFTRCYNLKNITVEGEIGNNISFADSTLLTHESLENIIIHLKDFAGTSTTRTLTICAESKAKLNEDGGIFMGIATQKGWTIA